MTTPINLINTSADDANTLLDIQVTRDPIAALELIANTYKAMQTQQNPRATLRKCLGRAGRNALKKLQQGA
ncbi:hypothetical protein [Oceanobacter kriegii]|uniref:hypothetical protein n=1 Tax=Oceanobacter kriegii TaxID=64972 RepID=UPI000414F13C|nr:hypothetical protein [Oceanobacter kriegii]